MSNTPKQQLVRFDWAMKNILRNKANFDVLEGFLTCLLDEEIKIENILESESNKDSKEEKINRVDLKCVDSSGKEIIVEIQNQYEYDYFERMMWGASKAVTESVSMGDKYMEASKVIAVSIVYHSLLLPEKNKDYLYRGKTEIIGYHTGEPLLGKRKDEILPVTSSAIFPEYIVICVNNFDDKANKKIDRLDEWVYLLRNEDIKKNFKAPGIKAAFKKLQFLSMTKEEQRAYEAYIDVAGEKFRMLDTAMHDGIEKGREEGREEGIKLVAKNLLSQGVSIDIIVESTGLSEEELRSLPVE